MSKELPYFQFEPAQYLSGDITLCSMEAQGVYINLCCLYWQKNCKLGLSKALRRFKQGLIDELIEEDVVKVVEDQIVISFLDEQFIQISERKERLSAAGRKGGTKSRKPGLSDDKATPKHLDKIRGDKIIEDKSKEKVKRKGLHLFKNSPLYDLNAFKEKFKGTDYEFADLDYYHESVKNWSESKGAMKKDWAATARNFMLGDRKDGKLVTKNKSNTNGKRTFTERAADWLSDLES